MSPMDCISRNTWRLFARYETSYLMVTMHPFFGRFLTLAYNGGPIGRPRSAERVAILHTVRVATLHTVRVAILHTVRVAILHTVRVVILHTVRVAILHTVRVAILHTL